MIFTFGALVYNAGQACIVDLVRENTCTPRYPYILLYTHKMSFIGSAGVNQNGTCEGLRPKHY